MGNARKALLVKRSMKECQKKIWVELINSSFKMNRCSNGQCDFIVLKVGLLRRPGHKEERKKCRRASRAEGKGRGVEEQEIPRNSVDGPRQRMWPHPRVPGWPSLLNLAPIVTSN